MARPTNLIRYFDSSPEVIRLVVTMCVKYPLSLRNLEEDLLAERGVDTCHERVRLWSNECGPMFLTEVQRKRGQKMRVAMTPRRGPGEDPWRDALLVARRGP